MEQNQTSLEKVDYVLRQALHMLKHKYKINCFKTKPRLLASGRYQVNVKFTEVEDDAAHVKIVDELNSFILSYMNSEFGCLAIGVCTQLKARVPMMENTFSYN